MTRQTIIETAQFLGITLSAGQEAVLRLLYGLPITDAEQLRLALKATGRESLGVLRHYRNAHVLAGRRSGKSMRLIALVAIHEAVFAGHVIPESETSYLPIIAPVESQARKTFKTILKLLLAKLESLVVGEPKFSAGEAEIELSSGVVIQVLAAKANTVRGGASVCVIVEEGCHFGREDKSAHPLSEIVGSLLPSLLTHDDTGAKMFFVSSPWVKSGLMYEAFRDRVANEEHILVCQLASRELNPTLSEVAMQGHRLMQGETFYQREYLSEFVDSGESLIPAADIDAAVVKGAPFFHPVPLPGSTYVAGFDLSSTSDDSALGIAHSMPEFVQLDYCNLWKRQPGEKTINPFVVLDQSLQAMQEYHVSEAYSDQVLQSVVEHTVTKRGILFQRVITFGNGAAPMWRVIRELFVSGKVRIPDNKILIQQLKSLEMKFVDGGGQAVEARRGKDDLSVACCLALFKAYEAENTGMAPWFEVVEVGGAAPGTGKVIPGQGTDTGWVTVGGAPEETSAFGGGWS